MPGASLALIVAFPLVAAAFIACLGPAAGAIVGDERRRVWAQYGALFGSSMALFFVLQAGWRILVDPRRPAALEAGPPWLVGESLALGRDLMLDPLAAAVAVAIAGLSLAVQVFVVGWSAEREDAHWVLAWVAAVEAAALGVVLARSFGLVVLAWSAVGLLSVVGIARAVGPSIPAAVRRFAALDALGGAALIGTGAVLLRALPTPDFEVVWIAAAGGPSSVLRLEVAPGIAAAEVAAGLVVLAVAVRAGLMPFGSAALALARAPLPLAGLAGAVCGLLGVYLLLRLAPLLTLAPGVMAAVVAAGLLGAAVGAVRAWTADGGRELLAWSSVSQHGLFFAAAGVGAWEVALIGVLAHAIAKTGLWLALAAVPDPEGAWADRRLVARPVVRSAFVLSLAVGGLVPGVGFFTMHGALHHLATDVSAWSFGINLAGAAIGIFVIAATAAYTFRLHYLCCARPGPVPDGPEQGLYAVALVALAGAALAASAAAAPEGTGLPRPAAGWLGSIGRLTREIAASDPRFSLGPMAAFEPGGAAAGLARWASFAAALAAAFGGWWAARRRWAGGPGPVSAGVARLDRLAAAVGAAEDRGWSALGRGIASLSALVRGWEGPMVGRAAAAIAGGLGSSLPEPRRVRRLLPAAAVLLAGALFVVGWVLFKPPSGSVAPGRLHGVGGLRPVLYRPSVAGAEQVHDGETEGPP